MTEVALDKASQKVRDTFNKGFTAFERGNIDYAIDLLSSCIALEPGLLQARKFLRAAEIQKAKQEKKTSSFSHMLSSATSFPAHAKISGMIKAGKGIEALAEAEKLLRKDPLNKKFIEIHAKAALAANMQEVAIQTLEVARDNYDEDPFLIGWLGELYQKVGRTRAARECFEKLCELCPNDPMVIKAFKDAIAVDAMNTGKWEEVAEKGGTYQDMIKDKKGAEILEKESKAVKSEKDVVALIADTLEKIKGEPQNINYYRALARLYADTKAYDDAVATLEKAISMSPGDPELDSMMSGIRIAKFDNEIEMLEAAESDADTIAAKRYERESFVFENLQERVQRYPNDLKLRFEWGIKLYENDYVNEAIQQFQLSQRNPKYRSRTLYYLALCFKQKKQLDMATEQLRKAVSEMSAMDDTKKDVLYELGCILEEMGKKEDAMACYKQVYQVDIGYKDISQKIEKAYQ
ncbi:MAG: tetratricopeptide repeat protein [Kiritimatiellae bacterium]|nr:tetratricopeptide repeat protein [Kiritimatiellia bacterium]MDD5522878.1 tetratricopeptide repeat protein [Kiritimatiellia bacterium]